MNRRLWNRCVLASVTVTTLSAATDVVTSHAGQAAKSEVVVQASNRTFVPPHDILAPTIAGDSPASPWYFPSEPVRVVRQISAWLATATSVNVQFPKVNQNLVFNANIGPAMLNFADGGGTHFTVEPAYYIGRNSRGYHAVLVPNIVAYAQGQRVQFLRNPNLYHWLANDTAWQSEYRQESWTNPDKEAIHAAKASGWGMPGLNLFPAIPGINNRSVPMGGQGRTSGSVVPGTVESLVDTRGSNRQVTFIEVWNNGAASHEWTFLVSRSDKILKHAQSGELPPQDRK